MSARLHVYGLDELDHKLDRIARDTRAELTRATDEALAYTHGQVPSYPPEPPASDYRRTGTLGREITTEVRTIGSEIVGAIGTATVYAPWVISDKDTVGGRGPQAWMHRGRWWTLQGVVRGARAGIVDIYRRAVERLLKER